MEISYNKLRKKDVISISDGKHLGRVCDAVLLFPENKIKGFFVTGSRGFKLMGKDIFIPVSDIAKIGEDVILVNFGDKPQIKPPCPPPDNCPPPCPPNFNNCPPNFNNCPPCPPPPKPRGDFPKDSRRSYDEYE